MLNADSRVTTGSTKPNLPQFLAARGAPREVPDRADHAQTSRDMASYITRAAVLWRSINTISHTMSSCCLSRRGNVLAL